MSLLGIVRLWPPKLVVRELRTRQLCEAAIEDDRAVLVGED